MNLFSLMRQFTIRFRMLGAIAVVLGLLGLLGGAGMFGMFRIYSMSEDFMNSSFQEVGYLAQLHSEMGAIRQYEKDMIIGYEKPEAVKATHPPACSRHFRAYRGVRTGHAAGCQRIKPELPHRPHPGGPGRQLAGVAHRPRRQPAGGI